MKGKEAELVASCEKASPPYSGRYTRAAAHPPSPIPSLLYRMTPRKIQKAVHLGGEFLRSGTQDNQSQLDDIETRRKETKNALHSLKFARTLCTYRQRHLMSD
jgi:hypothetical protein